MPSEQEDREQFDYWANDMDSWKSHGESLHGSALVLRDEVNSLEIPQEEVPFENLKLADIEGIFVKSGFFNISLMLQGYAVEVFLKALWLHGGKTLTEESGKYALPGLRRDAHDLHLIADAVGFEISDKERSVLERLSFFAKAYGRYPVTKHHQHTPLRAGEDGVLARMAWKKEDHEIVEAVIERLKEALQ